MKVSDATAAEAPISVGGGDGSNGGGDAHSLEVPLPKKGGECRTLDGAVLVVQSGSYNPRKDALTYSRVPATERHLHVPSLKPDETLWSEVYALGGKSRLLKAGVLVVLPVRPLRHFDVQDMHLRVRCAGEETWQYCDFAKSEKLGRPCIEFPLAKAASFVVTASPKTETFVVTDQGLLYNAKISHYVSIRFPKKSIDANQMEFSIQIRPLEPLKMALMKEELSDEVGDFVAGSDFYDIVGPQTFFKRPLTVKLGLPAEGFDEEHADCIALLRKSADGSGGWTLVDEQLKFTKTTVTFSTSHLGRFIVARAKPKRTQRLASMLATVELRNARVRCAVVASLRREKKSWTLWVDAAPLDAVASAVARRESVGAACVDRADARALRGQLESDEAPADGDGFRGAAGGRFAGRYYRSRKQQPQAKKENTYLALADSAAAAVRIEVCGDIQIVGEEESGPGQHELLFCEALRESARAFAVQPRKSDYIAAAAGVVNVYFVERENASGGGGSELARSISIPIDAQSIDDYYRPDVVVAAPEPTPMEVDAVARPPTPEEPPRPELPRPVRLKPVSAHLARLAESKRAAAKPVKEPRVLSGKSLQALSAYVTEGLSLAVHLGISESVITGIGFDALSNGLGLPEVTYRMLLRWKRSGRASGAERVGQLSEALKAIGRVDVAALVWECHARCQELTVDNLRTGHTLSVGGEDDDSAREDAM